MTYRSGVLFVVTGAALWSLLGLAIRQLQIADTWQVLLWRSAGAIAVLGLWVTIRSGGHPWPRIRGTGRAGVIGGLALVAAFAGAIHAIQSTTVANAVFLFSASPFLAAILGWLILREPVRPATWAAIALAGIGMFVMVREGLAAGALSGNIAALASAMGFASFTVALRHGHLSEMMPVSLLGAIFSLLVAGLVLAVTGTSFFPPPQDIVISIAMGAVILAVGMILYTLGSRVIPAAEATLLSLVEVMLAPVWVWLVLDETASPATFAGGAVVLAAVVLNAFAGARARPRRAPSPCPPPAAP
ncbi:MAG: DMT family transporter [Paracoccaceae bacterium]